MAPLNILRFPNKSHRKNVRLPKHSAQFAEFIGIMLGDGGINNKWQANITLNATADAHYAAFVASICKKLFAVTPAVRNRIERNAVVISIASAEVVDFLVSQGLCRGNKIKQGAKVPKWVRTDKSYKIACVRGLVDTDGCLFIHKHTINGRIYKNIGLCFTSYCPAIIAFVIRTFADFGIPAHISDQGRRVYLYSEADVLMYMQIFGTSNKRISSVYKKWRGG